MAEEKPPIAAHEPDQISNEHTGTDSKDVLSQVSLLQPLEDSQDSINHVITEYPTLEQPSTGTDTSLKKPQGIGYFTRPVVETAEEIAAGFQFQKAPPPRRIPHGPSGRQGDKIPSATSSTQEAPHNRSSSGTIDNSSQEGPLESTSCAYESQEPAYVDQSTKTTDAIALLPRDTDPNIQKPDMNASDTTSSEDTCNYPFPDEMSLQCSKKTSQGPPRSSIVKAQLPKAIADTRRKALAKISPRNRSSRAKAPSPPAPSIQGQSTQEKIIPSRKPPSGDRKRTTVSGLIHGTSETPGGDQVDEFECNLGSRFPSERQGKKGLTRPMREYSTRESVCVAMRPCSQASSISRPRAPRRAHRPGQTPTREQDSLNLEKFAKSWNTNYLYNKQLLDRWEEKMMMLESQIASRNSTIGQCEKDIKSRDRRIQELSNVIEEFRNQSQAMQDEITASSNLRKKLEEKLRSCRTRLNEAINEQQRLFLQCKENCQKAISSVKADGQAQQESMKNASATLDATKAKIREEVDAVVKDAGGRFASLNDTIKSLEVQLEGRMKELECAERHAEDLRQQLAESNKIKEQLLQPLVAQNRELLEKVGQNCKQAEITESYIQKQGEKIDAIRGALEDVKLRTAEPVALIESLKEAHNDSVTTIIAEVRNSTESARNVVTEDQEILNTNLGEVRLLCEGIYERMTSTDDVALWQGRVHESGIAIHDQVQQIQLLQDELHQTHICLNEERQQRQELERQLEGHQTAANNKQAADEEVNCLTEQVGNLQQELDEKDIAISESGRSLEVAREELATQAIILQGRENQLRDERETHERALELATQQQNHAVSHAVAEKTDEFREKQQALENRLQEAEKTCAQLEQEQLLPVITLITNLAANLEKSEREREVLRGDLEKWSSNRIETDQKQQILWRLAKDQPNAIQMSNQVKEVLEIQKKLSGTLEYHQAGLAKVKAAAVVNQHQPNGEAAIKAADPASLAAADDTVGAEELQSFSLKRKVVVKSPVAEEDCASPVSIEQERNSRRNLAPLKGIMKVVAHTELEEGNTAGMNVPGPATPPTTQPTPTRRVARRGPKAPLSTRSMYNRPVAGSLSGSNKERNDAGQASPNEHLYDTLLDNNVGEPPAKRQRTLEVEQGTRTARVGLSRSLSETYPGSQPEKSEAIEGAPPKSRTYSLRGGPLERQPSGLVTYGSQNSRRYQSYSQSPSTSETVKSSDSQSTIASSQTIESESQG
ncbi:hypothetical protein F5Y04DRAFT_290040 [Hypomontagnella monticulosa]|nr:hypothetical protein F5Y04DRAFT_290040 [Hypomontagnella monticulosa]